MTPHSSAGIPDPSQHSLHPPGPESSTHTIPSARHGKGLVVDRVVPSSLPVSSVGEEVGLDVGDEVLVKSSSNTSAVGAVIVVGQSVENNTWPSSLIACFIRLFSCDWAAFPFQNVVGCVRRCEKHINLQ